MRAVLHILRFRLRAALRFVRESAFVLAVLAPVIVGTLALILDRYLPLARARLLAVLDAGAAGLPGPGLPGPLGLGLALLLTAFGLSSAFAELYPRRSPATLLDQLPVSEHARFGVAWIAVLAANAVAWGTLVALGWLLGRGVDTGGSGTGNLAGWAARLAAAFLPLAGLQLVAVQLAVRSRLLRLAPALVLAGALVTAAALSSRIPVAAWALAPWLASGAQLERGLAAALGASPRPLSAVAGPVALLASTLVACAASWWLARHYRRRDLAAAHNVARVRSGLLARALEAVTAPLPGPVAAQVVRDALLVARRFSPAVYVAAALALLAAVAVATAVPALALDAFWRGRLALIGAVAGVLALVALVPFVLRHELPRFWLETSAGVDARTVWRAKLWLARLLAVPGVALGALAISAAGVGASSGMTLAVALGELLLAAWVVASLIGVATFEIADRPLLGLVFSALIALAWAALMILYRQFLPFWLIGYVIVASAVADRATRRVRFMQVVR